MKFKDLSVYLQKLETTPSRNEMILILSELFEKVPAETIGKVMYLLQGRVVPLYVNLEFGFADKMLLRAIALAFGADENEVSQEYKNIGDIGEVAQKLSEKYKGTDGNATITEVYGELENLAKAGGKGSVEVKIDTAAKLLKTLDPLSCRYVSRIPVAKLRLGFSDMTVLDSLSWMLSKDKSHRVEIERAYNIRPDLGFIATVIKKEGIKGLSKVLPAVFTPILMARAERLSSGDEIIEKIGKAAIEPKFDGFRLQAHLKRNPARHASQGDTGGGKKAEVKLFTRNLEEVTFMYPDVEEGIISQIDADEAVFEGEAIAFNPATGEYLPFQLTSQRKRKYGIEEAVKTIPLKYMAFDLLYINGKNMIPEAYTVRREKLTKIIKKGATVYLAEEKVMEDGKEVENFFDDAIARGLEGILAKKLDGVYQAGARGWSWIKLKRSYSSKLDDTVDCLVMGYYVGRGKRTVFGLGAFLIGVYDPNNDKYLTVAKIGTGLTDEEWKELFKRSEKIKTKEKPALYEVDKMLEPDVWVKPSIVVEIRADELTRSPNHTVGRILKPSKSGTAFDVETPGYALRFPRLERFRDDKSPTDATTVKEIEEMFKLQKK